MPKSDSKSVTVRVRIGESEIEVTGSQHYVDTKVDAFIAATRGALVPAHTTTATPKAAIPSVAKPISPAQFFKKHPLKSDVDRVLVGGYFLEKHRHVENFTAADIRALIAEAKVPPPKNPSDAINKNIKKAQLMPAGERDKRLAFVLTSDGESTVEQMLTNPNE